MKNLTLFAMAVLFSLEAIAQPDVIVSEVTTYPRAAVVNMQRIGVDYAPRLQNLEMPVPGSESYRGYLLGLKERMGEKTYLPPLRRKSTLPQPHISAGFEGNLFGTGVPNDNTLAISNDGKIISIINSNIFVCDTLGNEIKAVSLAAFSESLGLAAHKYDPRVVYDPLADRFVMVFLNGNKDTNSFNIFAFSQTNDPAAEWNLYKIPGNPLNDTSWSDFPMIALTENEVFYTVNLLQNDKPWQEAFKQTVVWQMDKWSGYNGEQLLSRYITGMEHNGRKLRNVCPVQGGKTLYGPDIYMLSNRNFNTINDTFFVIHIQGRLHETPQVTVTPVRTEFPYGVPPQARQPRNYIFDTNDARVLDAKQENGKIYFVGNTRNFSNNLSAIYFGELSIPVNATSKINGKLIEHESMDLGYPAMAYTGDGTHDEYMIVVNHSSPDTFPGHSVIYYHNGESSELKTLKSGVTHVSVLPGSYERWGDYSGAQRMYNQNGVAWVSASFGKTRQAPILQPTRVNGTWITRLNSTYEPDPLPSTATVKTRSSLVTENTFGLEFDLPENEFLEVFLFDTKGRLLSVLLREQGRAGKNLFTFSTHQLPNGMYLLQIKGSENKFNTQKIVVVE